MFFLALLLLATAALIDARPSKTLQMSFNNMVIDGENADPGEFPWQLSQQQLTTVWQHWCGASLLSATKVLSAAHCLEGSAPSSLRFIAGLHDRSDTSNTVTADVASYVLHPDYDNGAASIANDVAVAHLASAISPASNIQYATLPANNVDNYAGETCIITGWGRTSNSNILPNILQKASMTVLTTAVCQVEVAGISDIWDNHICVHDTVDGSSGVCNADSGGPLNCGNAGSMVVTGVTSFVIGNLAGNCLPEYPSMYTRTSAYLQWINDN